MTLHNTIKHKVSLRDREELFVAMGYGQLRARHSWLDTLLAAKSIHYWIKRGRNDPEYGSRSFLIALGQALGIESAKIQQSIDDSSQRIRDAESLDRPYIFVDTHFVKSNQMVMAPVSLNRHRNLMLDEDDILYQEIATVQEKVGEIIRKHYQDNNGKLMMWGKIQTYVYHHNDGTSYQYDVDGTLLLEDREVFRSGGFMGVRGNRFGFGV